MIGERWRPATGLLAAVGVVAAFRQVGFNWAIFMRALDDTRPMLVASLTNLAAIAAITIPLMIAYGITGYAIGMAAGVAIQIVQRGYYLRRIFPEHRPLAYLLRAVTPVVPPAALVLASRIAFDGDRSGARVVAELVLYVGATVASTLLFERPLVTEVVGYLRGGGGLRSKAAELSGT